MSAEHSSTHTWHLSRNDAWGITQQHAARLYKKPQLHTSHHPSLRHHCRASEESRRMAPPTATRANPASAPPTPPPSSSPPMPGRGSAAVRAASSDAPAVGGASKWPLRATRTSVSRWRATCSSSPCRRGPCTSSSAHTYATCSATCRPLPAGGGTTTSCGRLHTAGGAAGAWAGRLAGGGAPVLVPGLVKGAAAAARRCVSEVPKLLTRAMKAEAVDAGWCGCAGAAAAAAPGTGTEAACGRRSTGPSRPSMQEDSWACR
mmetsp:Transcript_14344/g.35538  ORF Transcript_14344/g.35538 Transcript_14344/m.35538 type:complete len:261 (-) Transcript_14344:1822-2604(-)